MADEITPPSSSPSVETRRKAKRTALLGLARRQKGEDGRIRLRPQWRRIGTLFLILLLAGWTGKTAFFYWLFKHRHDYPEITVSEMALFPLNWPEFRRRMGDYHVTQSEKAIAQGDWRQAFFYARVGTSRSPHNVKGRVIMARLYLAQNRLDRALQELDAALPHGREDVEFLGFYCRILLAFKRDNALRELTARLLPQPPVVNAPNQLLAMAAAQSNFFRGNYRKANALIDEYQLTKASDGMLLSVRLDWNSGSREAALKKLDRYLKQSPNEDRFYGLMTRYQREAGNPGKAITYAVMRAANDPLTITPRIDLATSYLDDGKEEKARQLLLTVTKQFQKEPVAMQRLANFVTDAALVDISQRLYELALENGYDISIFALLFIESSILAGAYDRAVGFTEELAAENPDWLYATSSVFNSLRSLAYYGSGNAELGELYLGKFLQQRDLRAATLLAVADRYRELGFKNQTRRILEKALEKDPSNEHVVSKLITLDLDLGRSGDLHRNIRRLINMRIPSPQVLESAYLQLGKDRFLFTHDRDALLGEIETVLKNMRGA